MASDPPANGESGRARRRPWGRKPLTRYDGFVRVMRIALPLAALALLATIIAYPLVNPKELSFLVSKERAAVSEERLRMERPRYRGVDRKGRPFVLAAQSALQPSSATPVVELRGISAEIALQQGRASLSAEAANYQLETKQLRTIGRTVLTGPGMTTLVSRDILVDMPTQAMSGTEGIEGSSRYGYLSGDRFRADLDAATWIIDGNARLRLDPRGAMPLTPVAQDRISVP